MVVLPIARLEWCVEAGCWRWNRVGRNANKGRDEDEMAGSGQMRIEGEGIWVWLAQAWLP